MIKLLTNVLFSSCLSILLIGCFPPFSSQDASSSQNEHPLSENGMGNQQMPCSALEMEILESEKVFLGIKRQYVVNAKLERAGKSLLSGWHASTPLSPELSTAVEALGIIEKAQDECGFTDQEVAIHLTTVTNFVGDKISCKNVADKNLFVISDALKHRLKEITGCNAVCDVEIQLNQENDKFSLKRKLKKERTHEDARNTMNELNDELIFDDAFPSSFMALEFANQIEANCQVEPEFYDAQLAKVKDFIAHLSCDELKEEKQKFDELKNVDSPLWKANPFWEVYSAKELNALKQISGCTDL